MFSFSLGFFALVLVYISVEVAKDMISNRILSPKRVELTAHHKYVLDKPGDFGLKIETFNSAQGCITPTLVVESTGNVSEKGKLLRSQLKEMGVDLVELSNDFQSVGTVILLHGRNGKKEDLLAVAERFCAVGLRCVLPDLPAHGGNRAEKCFYGGEKREPEFVTRLLGELETESGKSFDKVHLWGMSMGGSYANFSAAKMEMKKERVCKSMVVLESFTSLSSVLENKIPGFMLQGVKEKLLLGGMDIEQVRPVDIVGKIKVPVMLLHGDKDTLIPFEIGKNLFAEYGSENKQFIKVTGAGHDNILITAQPIYALMAKFILEHN